MSLGFGGALSCKEEEAASQYKLSVMQKLVKELCQKNRDY